MTAITPFIASGSTNGRMVKIVAVATAGTALHTAIAGTDDMDEVTIYAVNSDTSDVKLTIEYGGVASPDDLIEFTVPAEDGMHLILPAARMNNGLAIAAFAGSANVVMCLVTVNRIYANPTN